MFQGHIIRCQSTESDRLPEDAYLTAGDLKRRGWTDRLIKMFLGSPDRTLPNPHVKSGSPKRLYLASRVEAIEQNGTEFREQRSRSQSYSQRIRSKAGEKRAALTDLSAAIILPDMTLPFEQIVNRAREKQRESVFYASQPVFRVALDILLDTMKSLEWELDEFMYHSGVRDARRLLRRRMLAHIIDNYPDLAEVARVRAAEEDGGTEG